MPSRSRAARPSSTGKSRSPPSSAPAPNTSREADALNHVAGYCVCNDVSERYFQIERGGQWTKGKSHDTFGPLGPWLVTKDEIPTCRSSMWLDVNGQRRQTG